MKLLEQKAHVLGCILTNQEHGIRIGTGVDLMTAYNILFYLRRGNPYLSPCPHLNFIKSMVMLRQRSKRSGRAEEWKKSM